MSGDWSSDVCSSDLLPLAASVAAAAAAPRFAPPPFAIAKLEEVWGKELGRRTMEGQREEGDEGRRRGQMASKKLCQHRPPYLPQSAKTIAAVKTNAYAPREIWPYTWRPRRATVAGHSAHYARESRKPSSRPVKIAPERSNQVHAASSLVNSAETGPQNRVTSYQSLSKHATACQR